MKYRGFEYYTEEEDHGDCWKLWHCIRSPSGREYVYPDPVLPYWFVNLSPYTRATREQFERCVDEIVFIDFVRGE